MTDIALDDLTRPIVGIENRTAQEVFDIMCDRFRRASPSQVAPQPQAGEPVEAHGYATRLLTSLMEKHYPDRSPEWAPLPDLYGVLTQIDNLSTGLVRASPQRANPAQVTDEMTPESYVADYIAHGERSVLPLPAWEKAYQDAGLIDEAQNLGYIWLGSDVACTVEVTAHGRTAAELHRVRAALTAAIGAGGQAVAVWRLPDVETVLSEMLTVATGEHDDGDDDWLPSQRAAVDVWQAAIRSAISQPHPADERVVEALRKLNTPPSPVQKLGAAISRRDWHEAEQAHALIRDALDGFAKEGRKNG